MWTPTVSGDAELPEWNIGDSWEYETPYYGLTAKGTTEVTDITTINVNGTNYEVYVVLTTSSVPWGDIESYTYISVNDMAIVKKRYIQIFRNNSTETVTTYQPPKKNFDFPLYVGKSWTSSYTRYQSGGILGYINATENPFYEVTKIESITVEAGTFECYVIEESNIYGGGNKIIWYSPKIKNIVKIEDSYRITIETELTSYSVKGVDDNIGLDPIVFLYLLLVSLIIVALLIVSFVYKRNKEKARMEVPSTAKLQTQQPNASQYPPQVQSTSLQYPCPTCGQSLSFVHQYNRWYCHNCNRYL